MSGLMPSGLDASLVVGNAEIEDFFLFAGNESLAMT